MEKLFYFAPLATEQGTMPPWYDVVSPHNEADARAMGGRDVSDDDGAWSDYDAQQRSDNEGYL